MPEPVKIALVGLGNYAHFYWRALFDEPQRPISVIAGVDPWHSMRVTPWETVSVRQVLPYMAI